MRHRIAGRKFGRSAAHRPAMTRQQAIPLLQHGRITTTEAKAKELRRWVERVITDAKPDDVNARRRVALYVHDREVSNKLFTTYLERYRDRPGALRTVSGETPSLTAAGRTDAGAHAHGQVVGVSLARNWETERLRAALNASLPADVAVVAAATWREGFDARRDAVDRTYRYVVVCRTGRAPVTRRHTWTVRGPLDLTAMRAAAQRLVGTHDFAAFGGPTSPGGNTVRTVHSIDVAQHF